MTVERSEMFDGLPHEVDELLNAAASDLPDAQIDAGLLASMVEGVSSGVALPVVRRKSMVAKVLTAKVAAVAGVLLLTGGVASAATGNLPDPAQDAAADVADVVGLDIPKSDKTEKAEHENHGNDVSDTARDKTGDGEGNHGSVVCEVASDGKCKPNADETPADPSAPGNSADNRQDGEHRKDPTTSTTTPDDEEPATTTTTVKENNGKPKSENDSKTVTSQPKNEKSDKSEGDNRGRG